MELEIRNRFSDQILDEAIRRYGITADHIHLLDGFESFIYAFERDNQEYILRIGHSRRRTVELIHGEVDWINYLAAGGAGVAMAITSDNGNLVEPVDDGKNCQFLVTAFTRAQGRPPGDIGWTPVMYENYGHLLGRIHALSRTYTPPNPAWRRPEWDSPSNLEADKWLPPSEVAALHKFQQVLAHIHSLPRDAASYGLIHQDAHGGNFFVDEAGQFTLFDFDDCVYSWYIYDIAMCVFYMIVNAEDPGTLTGEFMPDFWHGYLAEYALDPRWLAEIPHFMKYREIDLYAVLYRSFPDLKGIDNPWAIRFLKDRKARIENDVPLVTFDFAGLDRG